MSSPIEPILDRTFPPLYDTTPPDLVPAVAALLNDRTRATFTEEIDARAWYCTLSQSMVLAKLGETRTPTSGAGRFVQNAVYQMLEMGEAAGRTRVQRGVNIGGPAHYILRRARWTGVTPYPVGEVTHLRSITDVRSSVLSRPRVQRYPPSPVSQTIFSAFPGRSNGTFFFVSGLPAFVTTSEIADDETSALLRGLNALIPTLRELFNRDEDYLGDGSYRRSSSHDQHSEIDQWFLPAVVETEVLSHGLASTVAGQASTRNYYSSSRNKTYSGGRSPDKYFSLCLTPYRNATLVALTYPPRSTFDRTGALQSTDLSWELLNPVFSYLQEWSRYWQTKAPPTQFLGEIHPYWSIAGRFVDLGASDAGWIGHAYLEGFKRAYQAFGAQVEGWNRRGIFAIRVPPLEWVLEAVEGRTSDG